MSIDAAKNRILGKVSLADVIGESIKLERRSGRLVGLCPFHEEKSPSFTIFDDHYFCFGCRAHGDAIEYIRKTRGMGFMETLKYLAEKYGIDVPELENSKRNEQERRETANLYKILRLSQEYFSQNLHVHRDRIVPYLQGRGFSKEIIDGFEFGYAPQQSMGLVNHLLQKGMSIKDAVTASVATTSMKDHKTYDFFQHRLMIPIKDHHGRLIAFGGRTMGDHPAKYKNSRETPLFDKSYTLFGLDSARDAIRRAQRVIIVEGYMDTLQLWNFGFQETVACLGTAVTPYHLQRLSQLAKEIILLFDGDQAGENAGLRTVSLALEVPRSQFKVVRLDSAYDPDSFLREFGKDALEDKIQNAAPLLDYAITAKISGAHELSVPDLIDNEILPWVRSVKDPIKQSFLVSHISKLTGVSRDAIGKTLEKRPAKPKNQTIETPAPEPSPVEQKELKPSRTRRLTSVEYDFLGHLYYATSEEVSVTNIEAHLKLDLELEPLWLELAEDFVKALKKGDSPKDQPKSYWHSSSDLAVISLIDNLVEKESAFSTDNRGAVMKKLAETTRVSQLKATRQHLKTRLNDANIEEQTQILSAIHKLNSEIKSLQG